MTTSMLTRGRGCRRATTPGVQALLAADLGSIGVVYGDIGTSPLYALARGDRGRGGASGTPTREAVLGVLSLILWALIVIVTLKYVVILLRADNNGEGGTLALMALAQRALGRQRRRGGAARHHQRRAVLRRRGDHAGAVGAVGGRGLKIVTPAFEPYVVPLTVVILVALFAVQSRGTAQVAAFFGPITLVWFIAIARRRAAGTSPHDPRVLAAFNPLYGVELPR